MVNAVEVAAPSLAVIVEAGNDGLRTDLQIFHPGGLAVRSA